MEKEIEKEKIILLDSNKIFLSLKFLQTEEMECLTEYGKGILNGLIDPSSEHKIKVVHIKDYNKLVGDYNKSVDNGYAVVKTGVEQLKEINKLKEELGHRIASYHEALDRIEEKDLLIDKQQRIINQAQQKIKKLRLPLWKRLFNFFQFVPYSEPVIIQPNFRKRE